MWSYCGKGALFRMGSHWSFRLTCTQSEIKLYLYRCKRTENTSLFLNYFWNIHQNSKSSIDDDTLSCIPWKIWTKWVRTHYRLLIETEVQHVAKKKKKKKKKSKSSSYFPLPLGCSRTHLRKLDFEFWLEKLSVYLFQVIKDFTYIFFEYL